MAEPITVDEACFWQYLLLLGFWNVVGFCNFSIINNWPRYERSASHGWRLRKRLKVFTKVIQLSYVAPVNLGTHQQLFISYIVAAACLTYGFTECLL
jgi:hypothetical protein